MIEYNIVGLHRTGTNLVKNLIVSNNGIVVSPYWKHYFATGISTSTTLWCTKHPYDWVWSMFVYIQTKLPPIELTEYLRMRPTWPYSDNWSLVESYNHLNEHWANLPNVIQVKCEDLLTINGQRQLLQKLKLSDKVTFTSYIDENARITKIKYNKRIHQLQPEHIAFIDSNLDPKVIELCKYTLNT